MRKFVNEDMRDVTRWSVDNSYEQMFLSDGYFCYQMLEFMRWIRGYLGAEEVVAVNDGKPSTSFVLIRSLVFVDDGKSRWSHVSLDYLWGIRCYPGFT